MGVIPWITLEHEFMTDKGLFLGFADFDFFGFGRARGLLFALNAWSFDPLR